jgi:signal transduction histidine kinase
MIKQHHSLSRNLSLGIMLLAVPLFVLSVGLFYMQSRELIHQEASERSVSILATTTQRVANYMGALENAARSNAWLIEENFTPDTIMAVTNRIVTRNKSVLSCSFGTVPDMFPQYGRYFSVFTVNNGDTIYTVREPGYEYFDKMWYKTPLKNNKGCWVNPFSDFTEATLDHNDATASFCLPLHAAGGRTIGVLAADFSFSRLTRIITASGSPYPSAYYMLLGGDGRYLVHPETNLLFRKTIFSENDASNNADLIALGHEMTAAKNGTMHLNIDNVYCHVSYRNVPGTDWSLALVIPADEMMGPYNNLLYVVIAIIIAGLLGIWWLSYRAVRQTVKPIHQLLDMTEQITEGHYDKVIPPTTRKDAVAQLQNSFSSMQQSIITHIGRIEQTAQEADQYNVEQEEKLAEAEESIRKKDELIERIMHQIEKPLNVIRDYAHKLRDSVALPQKQLAEIIPKMYYSTNLLTRNIFMLFDSSDTRKSSTTMYNRTDKVLCNQLVHDCTEYIHEFFPDAKIRMESEVPDDFTVQSNHLYITRTIRELLYNAAKYSDGEHIVVRIKQKPDTICFYVEDVGPGLPDDSVEMLYKPFMKVDNQSEGLGLGLPLCMRHITGLGGKLVHDADYKQGCRFIIELPR